MDSWSRFIAWNLKLLNIVRERSQCLESILNKIINETGVNRVKNYTINMFYLFFYIIVYMMGLNEEEESKMFHFVKI